MTFKINGTTILTPTSHSWVPREAVGRDGNGHPIYPPTHEYELTWDLVSQSDADQLLGFFYNMHITGSAVVELPQYRSTTYTFFPYSGCVLNEPQMDAYFQEHRPITLLISKIYV